MTRILKDNTYAEKLFFSQYQLWRNIVRTSNDNDIVVFVFPTTRKDLEAEVVSAIEKVRPEVQERVSSKFVKYLREELYEIRAEYGGNIFRVFFIFDDGNIVILFNGFQKKTQKTPPSEIEKALKIKEEYYESKK